MSGKKKEKKGGFIDDNIDNLRPNQLPGALKEEYKQKL